MKRFGARADVMEWEARHADVMEWEARHKDDI
jgi:hypothetical protein